MNILHTLATLLIVGRKYSNIWKMQEMHLTHSLNNGGIYSVFKHETAIIWT